MQRKWISTNYEKKTNVQMQRNWISKSVALFILLKKNLNWEFFQFQWKNLHISWLRYEPPVNQQHRVLVHETFKAGIKETNNNFDFMNN